MAGEDEGHFAVVKLEGRSADVDAPLPLDYWQHHQTTPHAADIKVERIGEDIVNSISIHQIQDEEAHLYDVVAVFTNNDKTVRVYSLTQRLETAVLDFPFSMNHATISPDGLSLAAVGDFNHAFFFTRVLLSDPPQIPKPHNRLTMESVHWRPTGEIILHVPNESDTPAGYFTTAWSPNSQMLAVGSEAGYITVFDMLLFPELRREDLEASIIATIPSSRPNIRGHQQPGAVRSMLFAPEPWDLLIWAEDQGRICISDLRTGLCTKQVISLDPKGEDLSKVELEELPSEDDSLHGRRLLQWADDFTRRSQRDIEDAINLDVEHVEAQLRQRHRRHGRHGIWTPPTGGRDLTVLDDDPHGLTAHEQQILESLRTSRQREEARSHGALPRSINYTSGGLFPNPSQARPESASGDTNRSLRDLLDNSAADVDAFPELSRTQRALPSEREGGEDSLPPLHAIQEYLMLRDQQHNAARQLGDGSNTPLAANPDRWLPRRRASVLPSPPSSTSAQTSNPIPPHALRATLPSTSTPPNDDDTPWRTISNAMNLARGPLFDSTAAIARNSDGDRNRDRIRTLGQQRDRLRDLQRNYEGTSSTTAGQVPNLAARTGSTPTRQYELLHDPSSSTAVRPSFADSYDILRRRGARVNMGANSTISRDGREIGVRTAGLAISRDGSTVWAATEEGIFEIKVALKRRLFWPAVEPR